MILSAETAMQTVFAIFALFWVVVVGGLFIGVGVLLKRRDHILEKQKKGGSHH